MNVDDFMAKLSTQTATKKGNSEFKKGRVLEKISLNFPGNFGRYQILPMNSVVEDYPFVTLYNTREICVPRKNMAADGTENEYNAWIKLLPKKGYQMKDLTGRIVSSLTAEEEQLLQEAWTVFDQLFDEVDARNNLEMQKNLLRKRNYTIFNGYCLNCWDFESTRAPRRQNFSGLFVCTAKGFTNAVEDNIKERSIMNGGDMSFVESIYNNKTTGRDGFMMFSISRSKSTPGFTVTVNHESGKAQMLAGVTIPEEDAELMQDPVETFLGYQARHDNENAPGSKRLFNAPLIKEAIAFMTSQLAAIRMAKQSGTSVDEAIKATNATALANAVPTDRRGQQTNDPMLASMSTPETPATSAESVAAANTAPFQTPPAARIDPTTGAPVNTNPGFGGFGQETQQQQAAPFTAPGFANPFGAGNGSGMPF